MAAGGLEELLLGELHANGLYEIAADLGMVPHGHLSHDGWSAPSSLSPLPPLAPGGLTPPDSSLLAAHPPLMQRPQLLPCVDPAAMHEADCAVVSCLEAADAAAVALSLSGLQLEQCSSQDPASNASAAAADCVDDNLASPQAAAAAAAMLDQLQAGNAAKAGHGGGGNTPAPATKRKRSTGKRASAAAVAAGKGGGQAEGSDAAAAGASGAAAAAAARQPAAGKGLRHFSLKVCEKVESKGATTYEEVANELIADLAAEVAAGTLEQVHDEKNIRRRVYDALNVLEAIGMISKVKKAIQWLGWPEGLGRSTEDKQLAEKARCLEQVEGKRQALQDGTHKAYCLSNLILRNREAPLPLLDAMREAGARVPNPLTLPFMLVQADQEAEVDVQFSNNNLNAHMDFQHWPFVLYDDDHVMRMLNLHTPQPQLYTNLPEIGANPPLQHQHQHQHQHQAAMQLAGMQHSQQQQQQPQQQQQNQHQNQNQQQNQNQRQIKREPGLRDAAPMESQQQQQVQEGAGMLEVPPPPFLQLQPRQGHEFAQLRQVQYHQRQRQQQQPPPLGMLLLQPPSSRRQPQQQQQHAAEAQGGSAARLTPNTRAGARLPTPNLQLSPELSSPSGPLGSSVTAIELSSPPASLARSAGGSGAAAAAAAFGRADSARAQQQQQQQQAMLRPTLLPAAAGMPAGRPGSAKGDLFAATAPGATSAAAPGGGVAGGSGGSGGSAAPAVHQNSCWSQWTSAPGGTTYMAARSEPARQQQPGAFGTLPVPQLRPASADTVQLSLQQQQQQEALGVVPMLRHRPHSAR